MPEWLITVLSVSISTVGAIVSVAISRRAAREERLSAAEELTRKFREPLIQAAFNLETRIYNMVELGFFGRFLGADSTDSEKEYAVLNTMHVFAQYFCWVEIVLATPSPTASVSRRSASGSFEESNEHSAR